MGLQGLDNWMVVDRDHLKEVLTEMHEEGQIHGWVNTHIDKDNLVLYKYKGLSTIQPLVESKIIELENGKNVKKDG